MNRGLKEVKERTMLVSGTRAFQTEGTADAKSLRQDQEHRSQCGWKRRADGKSDKERKEDREVMGLYHRIWKAVIRTFYPE